MPPVEAQAFRSVVGHYIAGTAGDEELDRVLAELTEKFLNGIGSKPNGGC